MDLLCTKACRKKTLSPIVVGNYLIGMGQYVLKRRLGYCSYFVPPGLLFNFFIYRYYSIEFIYTLESITGYGKNLATYVLVFIVFVSNFLGVSLIKYTCFYLQMKLQVASYNHSYGIP